MTRAVGVDLGTTALKVGVVDTVTGEVLWRGQAGTPSDDAEAWWEAVRAQLRAAVGEVGAVDAVCCTGLWAATVPVDATGTPVAPVVMWWDTQGGPHSEKVIGGPVAGMNPVAALRWVRKTGGAPGPEGADPIGHMLHLAHDRPDVHAAARWYLEPVDYLALRLTGVAAATRASMAVAFLTDNRTDTLAYDDDLVRRSGVDPARLPPLVRTGSVVGTVTDSLGLGDGVRVVTGLPDLHTAAFGTGFVRDFEAHMAISTSSWIGCPLPFKKTDIGHQIASLNGFRDGAYMLGNSHDTAGRCLEWARGVLVPGAGYGEVTARAATAPVGAGGVLFAPWLVGERSPIADRNARAGFHNVSVDATSADLLRAVLEGVAFNARWLHECCERFCKRRLDPVRIFGGGAASDLWCQIHADVMDRTIERVSEPAFAGVRGAALFAAHSLGHLPLEEVRSRVAVDRTFTPDPSTRATYDRLFAEFTGLHKQQKKMFARLNGR